MGRLLIVLLPLLSYLKPTACNSGTNGNIFLIQPQVCYPLADFDLSVFSATSALDCLLNFCFLLPSYCTRVSFDAGTQKCNISFSKFRLPIAYEPSCSSLELSAALVDVYTGLSLVAFWRLNSVKKGQNLGLVGSSLDVQKEDIGVTYTDDYVQFGSAVSNLTVVGLHDLGFKNFTFAFWINPDSSSTGWKPWFDSVILEETQKSQFHVSQGGNSRPVHVNIKAITKNTGTLVQADKWNYIVYTHNIATRKGSLFINTVEVSSYVSRVTLVDAGKIGDYFYFGVYNPRYDNLDTFRGKLKCVSFSDRILSAYEVKILGYACS